jgi:hypothetical protein
MLTIGPKDTLVVVPVAQGQSWVVRLTLATAGKPYAQPDDLEDALTHFARFPTYRDALEMKGRILAAGVVDERHWTWVPREAGRFGGVPTARPAYVGSFREYRHAPARSPDATARTSPSTRTTPSVRQAPLF